MILLFSLAAQAATVDVYPGDDIVSLTSSLNAGDEFVFHDGTYALATYPTWTGTGTSDAPIVLRAAEGESPVLEIAAGGALAVISAATFLEVRGLQFQFGATWEEDSSTGVYIDDSTDITFTDCTVTQVRGTLLYVTGNSSRLTVTDNHLHGNVAGHGLYIGCSDASCWLSDSTISHNWIHDVDYEYGSGIYLDQGGQGNTIEDNVVYNIGYRALNVYSAEGGEPNVVEGNAVWNAYDVGINARGASRVRNNVVFNIDGIGIKSADNSRDTLDDVVISFNTVANTTGYGVSIEDWVGREGNVFANNAVCNPTGYGVYYEDSTDTGTVDGSVLSGNVVCGLVDGLDPLDGSFSPGGGYDDFSDAEGWDFYPSSGSNLVDVGDPSGDTWVPETDFNGVARQGDAPDVGAYERTDSSNPGWAFQEGFKSLELAVDPGEAVGGCCEGKDKGEAALLLPLASLGWLSRRRNMAQKQRSR